MLWMRTPRCVRQAVLLSRLFVPVVLFGCASPPGPDQDEAWDVYLLESVESKAVPTTYLASASIRLNFNGTFVERIRYASSGLSGNFTKTGFFTASAVTVELLYSDQRPAVSDTLVVAGDALVRRDCDGMPQCPAELLYRRERE